MKYIQQGVLESKEERQKFRHAPRFAPAGQSTQVIVGATSESDKEMCIRDSRHPIHRIQNILKRFILTHQRISSCNKNCLLYTSDAAIGGSINDKVVNSTRYDSKNASLKFANVFNIANIVINSSASIDQRIDQRRQVQSIFGTAQIG